MSKYVIAWPQNYQSIKWLYYAEVRREPYSAPSGTKVIMRSALLAEAEAFDSRDAAVKALTLNVGHDNTAQIIEPTEEDWHNAKKEMFSQKLGNVSKNGTGS